ncbi:MAG: 4-alpha-glucanotransferase [Saccharofermentanales bacterium]
MQVSDGTGMDERYNYKRVRQGRTSGILCHITSLASPYGIGTLGEEALSFIDFLALSGQSLWQILPIGITGFGDSPYQTVSANAGNPYLIDLDQLVREDLLPAEAPGQFSFGSNPQRVDFGLLWENRKKILELAWIRFRAGGHAELEEAFRSFCREEDPVWLDDFALFMALKAAQGGKSWRLWPAPYKLRDSAALLDFQRANQQAVDFEKFLQFLFFRQWQELRLYASGAGISLVGDLPIYVAEDSVEVWLEPHLFQLDADLTPTNVAGCPPDSFSDLGQLWGNPLYDWEAHAREGFSWWTRRVRFQLRLYDALRIDHFRGLESYWAVPYGDKTARRGRWIPGPADSLFQALEAELGALPFIAEDLGYMTEEVYAFRERWGYPGMKVLQFAFNPDASSDYLPHNLTENAVLYTGTHDNDTLAGWFQEADPREIAFARSYLGLNEEEGLVWGMMRAAATSVCRTVIFQMQDLLGQGEEGRMNRPGTAEGNWQWRMPPDALSLDLASRMRELARMSGRLRG